MSSPQTKRDQLGQELQRLRNLAGLSGRGLATKMQMPKVSQVTVTRAENGKTKLSRAQIERWADATDASHEERNRLLSLLDAAVREESSWSGKLKGRKHLQDEMRAREAAAHTVRNFQPTVIPGLLQTPEYAHYVIPRADLENVIDHAASAARRLERQQILFDQGRRFEFLLGESALRWPATRPDLLIAQLDRIITLTQLPSVSVAVLPLGEPDSVVAWSNFIIFEGDQTYVQVELTHPSEPITEAPRVELYQGLFTRLWERAATGDEARAELRRIADEYRGLS